MFIVLGAATRTAGQITRSFLLHGTAGSGKSAAVRELAHTLQPTTQSFLLDATVLLASSAPQVINAVFDRARLISGGMLVVLEGLDLLACASAEYAPACISLLLSRLDNLLTAGNACCVLAVVREPDRVPPALRALFERRLEWPAGGIAQRMKTARLLLHALVPAGRVDAQQVPELSAQLARV